MTIPVLVLAFRTFEDDSLEQRMDDDYMRAFASQLVELKRTGFSNAYIVPIEALYPDQIALLRSRGAIDGQAKTVNGMFNQKYKLGNPIYMAGFLNYVCVFRRYIDEGIAWADAYVVALED
jgi:hypothetical protein